MIKMLKLKIILIISIIFISGCITPMGGCNSEYQIKELKIDPEISCLQIEANNCNGGILSGYNNCEETVIIGNHIIAPKTIERRGLNHDMGTYIEAKKDKNGNISIIEGISVINGGNISGEYLPEKDEWLDIKGKIGEKNITISYFKTSEGQITKIEHTDIPELSCLILMPSFGNIRIYNNCDEDLWLQGTVLIKPSIKTGENYTTRFSIEIIRNRFGNIQVIKSHGNYAYYAPEKNDFLSVNGTIGNKTFNISYIKTKL